MDRSLTLTRCLLGAALLSLALGLWQLGGAALIHGKAWLAQRLLDSAWSQTLAGAGAVKPWPWADTWPVARLRVPALEVDLYVLAGASGRTLAFGPALVAGTRGLDHRILSGHRDTHFAFLQHLQNGSRLEVQDRQGQWRRYAVRGHQVIDVRQPVKVRRAAAGELLTLVTCYPFDAVTPGGPLRYAVTAELIDRPRQEAASSQPAFGGMLSGEGLPDGAL